MTRRLATVARWAKVSIGPAFLGIAVGAGVGVWLAGDDYLLSRAAAEASAKLVPPVMAVSATVGGLATTMFFLTAQLKLTGVSQYGLTALYRFRDYAPILIASFMAIALAAGSAITWRGSGYLFAGALLALMFVLLSVVVLSLELITNMDPVTVARKFLRQVGRHDAREWGLAHVRVDPATIDIGLQTHRSNFGLRDPLMPVHELLLAANRQRYGQILSCFAWEIARAYRLKWSMQFPDVHEWKLAEPDRKLRLPGPAGARPPRCVLKKSARRLELVLLFLHYLRRIHMNEQSPLSFDERRRSVQFVLSRLIVVLARDKRLDPYLAEKDRSPRVARRRAEREQVLRMCVTVHLLTAHDFVRFPRKYPVERAHPASLAALVSAIKAIDLGGYDELAEDALRGLQWIARQRVFDAEGVGSAVQELAYSNRLRAIWEEPSLEEPQILSGSHPWVAYEHDLRARRAAKSDGDRAKTGPARPQRRVPIAGRGRA